MDPSYISLTVKIVLPRTKKGKNCNKIGHLAKVCRGKRSNVVVTNSLEDNSSKPVTITVNSPCNSIVQIFLTVGLQKCCICC